MDIVDPATMQNPATFERPYRYGTDPIPVLVNGFRASTRLQGQGQAHRPDDQTTDLHRLREWE